MNKPTPGPWRIEKTEQGSFWIQKGIAYSITLIGHKNAEADAHLIVIAPEMLEALKEFCEKAKKVRAGELDAYFAIGWITGASQRLIDKAEGE